MPTLRFALAQHDFPAGAVDANAAAIDRLRAEAARQGAALAAFPAFALSGSPPADLLRRTDFLAACERKLAALAADTGERPVLVVGTPARDEGGATYGAAAILRDGGVREAARQQTAHTDMTLEGARWLTPGQAIRILEIAGTRIAVLVGADIGDAAIVAQAAREGAGLVLAIDAEPWDRACRARREAVLTRQARASGCAIAWVNRVGGQDALLFDGGALLVDPDGRIVVRAPAFVDALLACEFDPATRRLRAEQWPADEADDDIALLHAGLVRGIRDYVHASGFRDVLLGLSGGIDSALTLALAVDALGAVHVGAVMLPSRYTSRMSHEGAQAQVEALGVAYRNLSIEATFTAALETLAPAFAGTRADTTEENLQARVRGLLLMALSNKHGKLLLATGNKSEAAMGYSTLYGDMCGGYNPLGDVYKTDVYRLARWRNMQGDGEIIPRAVIERAPSAELRESQTDQDSLPPYAELDAIVQCVIEQRQTPDEIVALGHDRAVVESVFRRLAASEFKRRQAAPAPRTSAGAFGRDRRWPINSDWR